MKIRLTQAGMQGFTGQMGSLVFQDGLSVGDVPVREAVRMAAVMGAVWEDGTSPSPAQALIASVNLEAPVVAPLERGVDVEPQTPLAPQAPAPVNAEPATVEMLSRLMSPFATYEDMVKLADEKGIAGLREIAEPLGIKARKVVDLLDALAAKFELKPAVTELVAEPVGEVPAQVEAQ
ncbi:hypothetical protein [Cupriavidus campinensis]|uniref:Uncharacterized protein n=1 Tax=Cupriavidus campinensis TaxID=151783 RepID=A0ABY3ESJ9_9BURK|nr:hypothetical protein [Cupriavidus campinensis]TSP13948.1 hypothetical protein FGG12_05600 [Cupriavidus campinensis]